MCVRSSWQPCWLGTRSLGGVVFSLDLGLQILIRDQETLDIDQCVFLADPALTSGTMTAHVVSPDSGCRLLQALGVHQLSPK